MPLGTFIPILVFVHFFCFRVTRIRARTGQTDRETDGQARRIMRLIGWPHNYFISNHSTLACPPPGVGRRRMKLGYFYSPVISVMLLQRNSYTDIVYKQNKSTILKNYGFTVRIIQIYQTNFMRHTRTNFMQPWFPVSRSTPMVMWAWSMQDST